MPGVKDRVALVTGASRGIGLATARLLEEGGAKVVGVARSEDALKKSGLKSYCVADLSTQEGCRTAVDTTIREFGRIDILVANHGLGSAHEKPIHEQASIDVYRQTMAANIDGPYYLCHYAMPHMVAAKYGRVVFTSSTAALEGGTEHAGSSYNTSKAALLGLMRSVCQDGGIHNITSNAVCPGWVRTEMAEISAQTEADKRGITKEEVWTEWSAIYPPKRVATPNEVAHTILFLSSEESSGVSGESIRVALGSCF
eukprot:CAMPEP_0194242374 /NCGR_PEP_ID=MMETSP0158-20130606/7930_1 /TAXON_ID=33649 /ORGANISM="Thalassionema nitzschioides, Strain L26-B" /LENGTH=255 /DNA_ID=CAMNT_0038977445 /DNA_START=1 /DNA_END=768 /DNA_ORIENTATION=-